MFRIDKNLVKLSAATFVQTAEIVAAPGPVSEAAKTETPRQQDSAQLVEGAANEAAAIISAAEEKASQLLIAAEAEAQELCAAARQKGFAEGANDAARVINQKLKDDDDALRTVLAEISREQARMAGELEAETIRLSLAVTKKIINILSENDDTLFESMITKALRQMNLEGKLSIRVGVREYDRFFSSGSAVFALGDGVTVTASVIKDALLQDCDCIIDTDEGTVNAGLDSQLRYIELAFEKAAEQ